MEEFEELLTVEEAAHALRVDEDTVRLWLRTDQLPGYKLGKSWRIPRSSLLDFLRQSRNNHKVTNTPVASILSRSA
jgi:excisionase family DNA binding protein